MSVRNGEYTRTQGFGQMVDTCRPIFYEEAVQSGEIDGRKTYRMVELVKVIMPGRSDSIPVLHVTDEHRERWPKEYEAFKKGLEPDLNGIPLEEWAVLNKAQVMELKAMNIRTIEDVANLSDTVVQRIGRGGYVLRERAQAYMDDSAKEEIVTRVTAENENMRERMAALERQVQEMGAMLEASNKQLVARADAVDPIATVIPASMDINERNRPVFAEKDNSCAFDNLAPVKRKPGRPRKDAAA